MMTIQPFMYGMETQRRVLMEEQLHMGLIMFGQTIKAFGT